MFKQSLKIDRSNYSSKFQHKNDAYLSFSDDVYLVSTLGFKEVKHEAACRIEFRDVAYLRLAHQHLRLFVYRFIRI